MNEDTENPIVYVLDANILMGFDVWMPIELNVNKILQAHSHMSDMWECARETL